jgi:hypothetical protein
VCNLLTIRPHEQSLSPKRIAQPLSHRLGLPALLSRQPEPTLQSQAGARHLEGRRSELSKLKGNDKTYIDRACRG